MAGEVQTTDATNSEATSTDASAATASSSSNTETADALSGGSILGDAKGTGEAAPGNAADDAGKPAEGGEGSGDQHNGDAGDPAPAGAPEGDYELSGLPEGTVIDKASLDAVTPIAKELGLSNDAMSKLAGVYAEKIIPEVTKQVTDGFTQQVIAQRTAWDAETRAAISGGKDAAADPIYAGKSYDDVTGTAAKALDRFGGADFRKFLNETGLGNHPAMVRFAYQAGSAISEDTDFVRAGDVPQVPKTREEKYYGSRAG